MKLMLKPPGTNRLKLQYDQPPSNFAFKFHLHHYTQDARGVGQLELPQGMGSHSFPFPLNSILLCPFPLNLS
jgi:hypothetical protein